MQWDDIIGLGVAGNFTGHLEQAGEASDFVDVQTADANAPKGIFPFYVPCPGGNADHFLHRMPISADTIRLNSPQENHQIEPEMAILCDLTYQGHRIQTLTPRWAMAHNDCSIRREGARKISEKKNWGPQSKGTANQRIAIDEFTPEGVLKNYRLVSYLYRDGALHRYGVDSPIPGYSYFFQPLIDWLIERIHHQQDQGPLEDLARWFRIAGHPKQALISVGATRYTDFGETHFLQAGDRSVVVLYDGQVYDTQRIEDLLLSGESTDRPGLSVLDQRVR